VPKWHLIYLAYLFVYFISIFLFFFILQQNEKHCLWTPDSRGSEKKTRLCAGAALRRDSLNIYGALSNWGAVVEVDGSSIRIDGRFLCRARGGRAIVR